MLLNSKVYIQYKELILNTSKSSLQMPNLAGLNLNEVYADSALKDFMFECISEIFLTPEDFAFNLKNNKLIKTPKSLPQKPVHYYLTKKNNVLIENSKFTDTMMNFFQTITFLMAYELFFHPLVKAFARRIYLEKVKISTQPKERNSTDGPRIDIYKPDFCVKRIKNRPFSQFKGIIVLTFSLIFFS